jgi:hypothetical protein
MSRRSTRAWPRCTETLRPPSSGVRTVSTNSEWARCVFDAGILTVACLFTITLFCLNSASRMCRPCIGLGGNLNSQRESLRGPHVADQLPHVCGIGPPPCLSGWLAQLVARRRGRFGVSRVRPIGRSPNVTRPRAEPARRRATVSPARQPGERQWLVAYADAGAPATGLAGARRPMLKEISSRPLGVLNQVAQKSVRGTGAKRRYPKGTPEIQTSAPVGELRHRSTRHRVQWTIASRIAHRGSAIVQFLPVCSRKGSAGFFCSDLPPRYVGHPSR